MKRCAVILTGAQPPFNIRGDNITICADSGAISLFENGIIPDYIVGDMDSMPDDLLKKLESSGSVIERYPVDKDLTDGEIAVVRAISFRPSRIDLYGGTSGRPDHVLSSYQLLHLIPDDIHSSLHLDNDKVMLIREGEELKVTTRRRIISILPCGHGCTVTIKGLKWELDQEALEIGSTLGIHNENIGNPFYVRVESGDLYLIMMDG